jgi:large subunit ribosomal protein L24
VQTTLLSFAIGLILALLAALIGPHFVDWNSQRAFFEAEASRLVGVPVRVGGNIDAGILPFPMVTLTDIAIGPERQASRLRARSLRIELGLGPLMRGEVRAVEMKLVAPELAIGLDRNGQLDWPALALSTDTLSIDRLSIENGRVAFSDAASQSQLLLEQLWFSGEVRSFIGPFRGKGEFVSSGARYGYDLAAGRYGTDGTRLKLALKTDERPLNIEADGLLAFDHGAPGFDGVLTLARPAGAVMATGRAVAYEPWRLSAKLQASAAAAEIDNVLFQYGPDERAAALTGTAEFKFGPKPQLVAGLSARQIDLDRLLATTEAPRRVPLAAVQAFGELLGGALRPTWPVRVTINVDAVTVGGAALQAVGCDVQSDGAQWSVERLEFRAPGFTQVKVRGRLYPLGPGLGFAGATVIDSNDPKNLTAWLAGRAATVGQNKPWHAAGDLTLGADRIAVERLKTEFGRGAVEGSASYTWPAGNRPARLDANLRAAELDVDEAIGFGVSALSGVGLEMPREVALAIEIDRARIAAVEAQKVIARVTFNADGIAIERLSIADLGNAGIEAKGRIATADSPGGNIALDLNARDIDGVVALAERLAPVLAQPLRRLAGPQKTAMLHADVSVANVGTDAANGKLDLKGRIGALRIDATARATGKRDAFSVTNPRALAETDIRLEGQIEADEPAALLAVIGLDRIAGTDRRPARLKLTAHGPPSRDFSFEGRLDAGPIDAGGKGVLRLVSDQPAALELDAIAGTVGGRKLQGRLALRFEETIRANGSFEAETIDAPAVVAAAIGLRPQRGAASGWSTEPLAWSAPDLTGQVAFKAQQAEFAPGLVAQQMHGVARFGRAQLVFEDVSGEMGRGRFEGRLAFANGEQGVSANVRLGLRDADASAMFAADGGPAVRGRLTVQAELEGAGRSPSAFIGSLAGFGAVTLERGRIAGLNPAVFDAVGRAFELGIPTEGERIRQFVTGVLDTGPVSVQAATVGVRINAGHVRFDEFAMPMPGADLKAIGGVSLTDGALDAQLTLTGKAAADGKARPALLIALKGPAMAPRRSIDIRPLTSWLTLLTVEQQSRQIDAMEKAAREAGRPAERSPSPASNNEESRPATRPAEPSFGVQAPVLPPPVEVPVAPRPRSQSAVPPNAVIQPPGLVGAQR